MAQLEVAISSDTTGQLWNCSAWDVHSGTSLMCYRGGGVAAPRSLCILGNDYIAASERTKPVLHIWPLNSQEQVQGIRFVLPGRATALAFSPDGRYCVAGIEEKIYIWQISSGNLLNIVSRHYQTVTSIKFVDDGSHFVSAGNDSIVMVWSLSNLVANPGGNVTSQTVAGQHDPLYIFTNHSLPVTDIYITKGGIRSRLVTVSMDRTCKIYNLETGDLLLNLVFAKSLSAVVMDRIEMNIFVGSIDGDINQFSIINPPRKREYYLTENDRSLIFTGHTKSVTCLSISADGETLISGSNDEQLLVWHIPSRQKIHGIPHKGPVTNAFFTIVPKNMFANDFNPSIILHNLQRTIDTDSEVEIIMKKGCTFWENDDDADRFATTVNPSDAAGENVEKLHNELDRLKSINNELYLFAKKNVLKAK